MRSYRPVLLAIAALAFVALTTGVVQACPGCKQALANADGEHANMVNGYFWSILFMLSMPFTLLGLFAGSMYLAVRRARKAQTHAPPEQPLLSGHNYRPHDVSQIAGG